MGISTPGSFSRRAALDFGNDSLQKGKVFGFALHLLFDQVGHDLVFQAGLEVIDLVKPLLLFSIRALGLFHHLLGLVNLPLPHEHLLLGALNRFADTFLL